MAPTSEDVPKTLGVGWCADKVNENTGAENVDAETNDERIESASRSSSPDTVIYAPEVPTVISSNSQTKQRKRSHNVVVNSRPRSVSIAQPHVTSSAPGDKVGPPKIPQALLEAARRYRLGQPLPGLPLETPVLDTYRLPQSDNTTELKATELKTTELETPPTPKVCCGPLGRSPSQSPQTSPVKFKLSGNPHHRTQGTLNTPKFRIRGPNRIGNMNYQNYLDTPQGGSGAGPRQAPSPSQGIVHTNGVNGGAAMPGMMGGLPTPAGHQSDLNSIYNMVESLHNELAETRARTERIVAAAGIIRQRAIEQNLTTDQIVAGVANELNESTKNLEEENARLRRALEHATHEEAAYKDLTHQYANAMGNALELVHAYKLKTTLDMCTWHRSYREQLADERAENLELRCRISDMQASAARGMEQLRLFRRGWDRSDLVMELRTEIISLRQQARGWKRVALSELPSDDSEFSDDDDVIDPEEKKRLARLGEEKKLKEELAARHADDGEGATEGATAALAAALEASHLTETAAGPEITL